MTNEEESRSFSATNSMALMNSTFIQLRLDTEKILQKIEDFLSARRVYLVEKNGELFEEEKQYGESLANNKGIVAILNMIHMRINHHVVQGNFKEEHYYSFIKRTREELASTIVLNAPIWNIEDKKLDMIIDTIMGFIEPFVSRVINNKERESYMNSFETKEVIATKPRGALQNFGNGLGGTA